MAHVRSAVILIEHGKVALIERVRDGHRYYLFPGGGVEPRERLQEAAQREAFEELGLMVHIERLVAEATFGGRPQYYFLARTVGGTFGTGTGPELGSRRESAAGSYCPVWLEVAQLSDHDVRPRALADALLTNVFADEHAMVHITE